VNLADVWEARAAAMPDAPALLHGDVRRSWQQFDERADGVAAGLLAAGIGRQAPVAQYLANGTEYLETIFACFKASLAPANTNHRYGPDELAFVWSDARAEAVVFHGSFTDRVDAVRSRGDATVRLWVHVDDGTEPCPGWAVPYESLATSGERARAERSGDDLFLLYTGGTTGMPKGVMWRQADLLANLAPTGELTGRVHLPACPLIHGAGSFTAMAALAEGGTVVTLTARSFDAAELLDAVERHRVRTLAIVGDPFARPILEALDAEPGRWDISSLTHIVSSGVAWGDETKDGLLRHHPDVALVDSLGSSEAVNIGRTVKRRGASAPASRFRVGPRTRVLDDDDHDVVPGSGQIGRVAIAGPGPSGYLNDPERSARTFPVIDGQRFTIPGDLATVDGDGTMVLLGRGAACINTGGEKVFPEEVEEALKLDPTVLDAAVVGVPDERWGERVVALIEPRPGATVDVDAIIAGVKNRLAGYKAPRHVVLGPIGRQSTGKLDYSAIRERVIADASD